ncbi:MAG: PIG-L family deacetylase [Planctomycetes bacterium]|nr:PIG-L family deacetylase [Planctomycetota bacterium]
MNVLVVAAHPDDEVLGAGGTIARHTQNGDRVTIAILGEGITSRHPARDQADQQALDELRADARRAAKLMGCEQPRLFQLPDNRFDHVDQLDVVKIVEEVVGATRPEIVYTHYHGDLNADHLITARAVLTACRPLPGSSLRRILAFEVPSSTGWGFAEHVFSPTVFVDVSRTLEAKLEAMKAYRSEVRAYPHPRAPQALAERARTWGTQVGIFAAEPFVLLRERVL